MDEAKDLCPECKGTKWRTVGDKARPCLCLQQTWHSTYLGADLAGAPQILKGPLYAIGQGFASTLDRTSENLFIKSGWPAVRPHLRLALGHRHFVDEAFRYSIVTDERIINVYVGNEAYGSRSRKLRDDVVSYNGLKDLVEGTSLLIVRLGFLGHKNIAAPGALKQALMIREVARKPTWVIQNPDAAYPISWNEEVAAYVLEHYDVVDLRKFELPAGVDIVQEPAMEVEEHEVKAAKPRVKREEPSGELMPTDEEDPYGIGRAGSKKPGRAPKRYGGGNRGGGNRGGGMEPPI